MEGAPTPARVPSPVDVALLTAAARKAAAALGDSTEPAKSIDRAAEVLYEEVRGLMPSIFVLEHGRLWLVAQRGYAVVPDGITMDTGITGRAIRLGRPQLAPDVRADPDYVAALPGVSSELAVPLRSGRMTVGMLNIESERALPDGVERAMRPLAEALAPLVEALRARRTLDLAGLPGSSCMSAASATPMRSPLLPRRHCREYFRSSEPGHRLGRGRRAKRARRVDLRRLHTCAPVAQ